MSTREEERDVINILGTPLPLSPLLYLLRPVKTGTLLITSLTNISKRYI